LNQIGFEGRKLLDKATLFILGPAAVHLVLDKSALLLSFTALNLVLVVDLLQNVFDFSRLCVFLKASFCLVGFLRKLRSFFARGTVSEWVYNS
jgi:hypothetical protein